MQLPAVFQPTISSFPPMYAWPRFVKRILLAVSVVVEEAQAQMNVICAQIEKLHPDTNKNKRNAKNRVCNNKPKSTIIELNVQEKK